MSVVELLDELDAHGIRLTLDGDRLRYRAPQGALNDNLRQQILYILAVYTGFRRNEIASITPLSFDFESEPPTVTVEAGYSKHRKRDILPLRRDFADHIQSWIVQQSNLKPSTVLFPIRNMRTAEMLKKDLDDARVQWIAAAKTKAERLQREASDFLAYKDQQGRVVDFHSLRMTFITNLSRSGVAPKTAQLLARHSDINLTMNTYTTLGVLDQAAGVEALPPLPSGGLSKFEPPLPYRLTGTDD